MTVSPLFITEQDLLPVHWESLHLKASEVSFTSANLFGHISDWAPFPPKALWTGIKKPLDHKCCYIYFPSAEMPCRQKWSAVL